MPRGQDYSKERWSELGKQGGRVSAMVRRDKILEKYLIIAREKGLYEALRQCRANGWKDGYKSGWVARKSNVLQSTRRDGGHSQ